MTTHEALSRTFTIHIQNALFSQGIDPDDFRPLSREELIERAALVIETDSRGELVMAEITRRMN